MNLGLIGASSNDDGNIYIRTDVRVRAAGLIRHDVWSRCGNGGAYTYSTVQSVEPSSKRQRHKFEAVHGQGDLNCIMGICMPPGEKKTPS